jgi:glyoxylase-like metal-dependent hydrolase (beta-lactamase superfamily II)
MLFRQLFEHESSTYTYVLAPRVRGEALLIDPVKTELGNGERIAVGGLELRALYTPGHTDDSYSVVMKGVTVVLAGRLGGQAA